MTWPDDSMESYWDAIRPQKYPRITEYFCTGCMGNGLRVKATLIVGDRDGIQWFECGNHDPFDNLAETERITSEDLGKWKERIEKSFAKA
jgi:hypothetical protein